MILITRPIEESLKTAKKLNSLGLQTITSPLLKIEELPVTEKLVDYDYLIITSYNAIKVLQKYNYMLPDKAFTVGEKSANALRELGIPWVVSQETAFLLKNKILLTINDRARIIYLSGDHITHDLQRFLRESGHDVKRLIVYKSIINNDFDVSIIKQVNKILFYSVRTAKAFKKFCANKDLSHLELICISDKVANELKNLKARSLKISKKAEENSIIELLHAQQN